MDYKKNITELFSEIVKSKLKELDLEENIISDEQINSSVEKSKGADSDISLTCFMLSKYLRKAPALIAEEIKTKLEEKNVEYIDKIEVVNGYVNIYLNKENVIDNVIEKMTKENLGLEEENIGKTVVIDYSSPNIAKQFHIGHLKTTVIGGMFYKLFKKLGYKVEGVNHLGDYGTQFGKLIEGYNLWKEEYTFDENPIEALNDIYIRINTLCKEDENVLTKCRDNFKKLEEGDEEMVKTWKMFIDLSMQEFNKIYDYLNVTFDSYRGESAYSKDMKGVVELLESKNILEDSEGAKIVNFEKSEDEKEKALGIALVEKSNGSSMYITRDIATFLYRIKTYDFTKSLYVVASEQILHFKQLFKIMEKLGVDKKYIEGAKHVPYGMVSLPTGKMSTRLGNVIKIEDLLKESVARTKKILDEKNEFTEAEKEEVARKVGVGAVIFSNLSTALIKDQVFVWDNVLDFTGDTAPYIQYVNVRINSILAAMKEKEKEELEEIEKILESSSNKIIEYIKENVGKELLNSKESYDLMKKIGEFEETLKVAADKYEPYILTNYLLDLAKAFNRYYNNHRILSENKENRIYGVLLSKYTSRILTEGMNILGIEMPEKM